MRVSDIIEEFIKELFNNEEEIEIQRNDLAQKFNCVPSQINYVIATRFKPSQGYYVESRRGGGGHITIKKVSNTKSDYIMHIIENIGEALQNSEAEILISDFLTYGLVNEKEANDFTTDNPEVVKLLAPMTEERNALRHSIIPSLLKIYEYNKSHYNKDVCIFEIGKTFYKKDEEYGEENKIAGLMTGNYYLGIEKKQVDFYIIKGIVEELLDYLGYGNRYSFVIKENLPKELHPGQSALISVNNDIVGIIGKIHPQKVKENVYVFEINLEKLLAKKVGKMKYKEISKYPSIKKDLAIITNKEVEAQEIATLIKKSAGSLLLNTEVFDVYTGKGIEENKKSIAYSLEFGANDRTLTDEEINNILEKIIANLTKNGAEIRK